MLKNRDFWELSGSIVIILSKKGVLHRLTTWFSTSRGDFGLINGLFLALGKSYRVHHVTLRFESVSLDISL